MFLNFLLINIQTKYILFPRQELNLTPLVKSQLPTPVCYEGLLSGMQDLNLRSPTSKVGEDSGLLQYPLIEVIVGFEPT